MENNLYKNHIQFKLTYKLIPSGQPHSRETCAIVRSLSQPDLNALISLAILKNISMSIHELGFAQSAQSITSARNCSFSPFFLAYDLIRVSCRQSRPETVTKLLDLQHHSNVMKVSLQLPDMSDLLNQPSPCCGEPFRQGSPPAHPHTQNS